MSEQEKNLRWYNLAMMAFVSVWGFGNVVNNFANQGLTVVVSWVLIIGLYFVPYALMVGELGSVFKDSKGGVSSWIRGTFGTTLAYFSGWTYWVVHIPYLAQKPQAALIALGWTVKQDGNFIKGMEVTKINGRLNQYTIQIVYQIQHGDDPNLLDKIFSSVGYSTIKITYGD